MFGIGGWEFMLIAVLALLLFGPDKLPQFARTLGRLMRDMKKYQAMMESTIRGEILAADPTLKKDPFETGKDFGKKVGSGGFTRPEPNAEAGTEDADGGEQADAGPIVNEDGDLLVPEPGDLIASAPTVASDADDDVPPAADAPDEAGEGERDEA
ncbi:MAG: twin-arginine translocase TatA/TatE family subunit [Coriobacteriia bacterium]|nr:twin-arginine translocase TatA/TatE family subunit [Coriobacteriia bacterium]